MFFGFSFSQEQKSGESWVNNTGIFSRYHQNKWSSNGVYAGLSAENELIDKRTKDSKTFSSENGSNTFILLGDLHYADNKGTWQDIDVSITSNASDAVFPYVNEKNKFITNYSASAKDGIKVKYQNNNFELSKNTKIAFVNNENVTVISNGDVVAEQIDFRTINYFGFAPNIDYQYIQLGSGIENALWLRNKTDFTNSDAEYLRVEQEFSFSDNCFVMADGNMKTSNFAAKQFELRFKNGTSGITFKPIVLYDAECNFDDIMKLIEIPEISNDKSQLENKNNNLKIDERIDPLASHKLELTYNVIFENGVVKIYYDIPVSWLKAEERQYPVFVDPTFTIGNPGTATNTSSSMFYNTFYHDQRLDYYLDQCYLQNAGINPSAVISEIGLLCSATPGMTINNPRIRMINSSQNPWINQGSGWTLFYQAGSLPSPTVSATVWNNYVGQNPYTHTGSNPLCISLSRDNSSWSSGGGNYVVAPPANCSSTGGFSDSGFTWPYDTFSQNTLELPATKLVYTGGTPPGNISGTTTVTITSEDVTLSWNDPSGASSWTVEYGLLGFTPGTGTTITANSNPFTVQNLSANTQYTFYVYNVGSPSYGCGSFVSCRTECEGILNNTTCFDFTDLTASNVICRYGVFANPNETIGVIDNGPSSISSRHTVHTDVSETDSRACNGLHTIPPCANASVRLGNWAIGAEAESITYEYHVNITVNELLVLKYAAVMEDPGHDPSEQPRFTIKFLNAAGQEINPACYSADFIASAALGWNDCNDVLWKDWTTVAVDLSALNGQTIYVQLTTYDCDLGGHYGYAYFTLTCGGRKNLTASACGETTTNTFMAPEGFTYRWYAAANPTVTLSTTQQLTVSGTGVYYCDCSFLSNNTCTFTLIASAGPRYPLAEFEYDIIDECNLEVSFTNLSDITSDGITPNGQGEDCETAFWDFGDGTTSTDYNGGTHIFPGSGLYNVMLISGLSNNQCTDTIIYPIQFNVENEYISAAICEGQTYNDNGFSESVAGTYTLDLGCGNTRTLTLSNYQNYSLEIFDSICANQIYNNYNFVANTTGDYVQTLTSIHGCDSVVTLHLTESFVVINGVTSTNLNCNNSNNGSVTIDYIGGTAPYTYLWNDGATTLNRTNIAAGNYSFTITDSHGCVADTLVTLTQPDELIVSMNDIQKICEGQEATVQASVIGGVMPYIFNWTRSLDPTNVFQGGSSITESPDTTTVYTLYVTDANNCNTGQISTSIIVSPDIIIDSIVTIDNSCYQSCDGEATIHFVGGLTPYTFSWGNTNNTTIKPLCAGLYTITISDQIGCSESSSYIITEPAEMSFVTYSTPVNCYGGDDGYAEITVQGGTQPYTYLWSLGQNTSSVNFSEGNYGVTVTDLNNCRVVSNYIITEPEPLFTESYNDMVLCSGQIRTLTLETTGGTPFTGNSKYNYYWRDSHGNEYFDNSWVVNPTENTTYSLTVTDANGCTFSPQDFTISIYQPIVIQSIVSDVQIICPGESVEIRVNVTGGNGGPYMMRLQDGTIVGSPFVVTPRESTTYYVTIEDMCGSPSAIDSIYIEVRPDPTRDFSADILSGCPPLTVNFTDLTTDSYDAYLWDFGDNGFSNARNTTHTYTVSGTYSVDFKITDALGCTYVKHAENLITVYPKPKSEFAMSTELITTVNPEVVFTNLSSGATNYLWAFGDGDSTILVNPTHRYMPNIANYTVCLIAENDLNCVDTSCREIAVEDIFTYYAPTSFSPNNDGVNDCFGICGHNINTKNFNFSIFDRWGHEVFKTTTYIPMETNTDSNCSVCNEQTWNGKRFNKGEYLESGVYVWYCNFEDNYGMKYEKTGTVTLLR